MFSKNARGIRVKRNAGRGAADGALPEKRVWLCFVATLSVALWSINLIPLQQIEYLFSSRVALSQHRLSLLQRMANTKIDESMHMIDCTSETQVENLSNSEMQAVRVRIILTQRMAAEAIAKKLDEMTVPKFESTETVELAKKMRWTRWQHQVANHMIRRLELDQEREREVNSAANSQRPFQLTGYTSPSASELPGASLEPGELHSSLEQVRDQSHGNLLALSNSLESVRSKSRGFLSLTGAPKIETIARPVHTIHVVMLLLIALMIWVGLYAATNTGGVRLLEPIVQSMSRASQEFSTVIARRRETAEQKRESKRPNSTSTSVEDLHRSKRAEQTIDWLQRNGITYFGPIQLQHSGSIDAMRIESTSNLGSSSTLRGEEINRDADVEHEKSIAMPTASAVACDSIATSYVWLRRLIDSTLLAWVGLFLFRFATDAAWRDLFVVAPLAAFSRLICGMP